MFVWFVELPVLSPEVQPKLEVAIEQSGLRPGVLRSHVNGQMIASEAELAVSELSWVGLCVNGSSVIVDAREMERIIPPIDTSLPCNVVASAGGVIVSTSSGAGELLVSPGQTVASGDLLISGVIELSSGDVIITHAMGEIIARVDYLLTAEASFEHAALERTGRVVTLRRLSVLGAEVPLYFGALPDGRFERETDLWQLTAGDTGLPLSVRTERWFELNVVHRILGEDEARALALSDVERQIEALGDVEIVQRDDSVAVTDAGVTVSVSLTVCTDIARSEVIEIN